MRMQNYIIILATRMWKYTCMDRMNVCMTLRAYPYNRQRPVSYFLIEKYEIGI